MHKNIKKRQSGFTIIEVLIVLAIAGLIMLIVFLAVPALQRNSRNTQSKNAASALLAGVNEFSTNNQGKKPSGMTATSSTAPATTDITNSDTIYFGTTATNTTSSARIQGSYTVSFVTASYASLPADGTLVVVVGFKCDTAGEKANISSARAASVVYALETSGTSLAKCVDS